MDYISNLPDEIISYILSFLYTKSSVKTCILSKRWQYVWTKVPALDFNDMPPYFLLSDKQKIYLKNFVTKVLLQNDVSCLQCFTFNSADVYDYEYIGPWLRSIARREVCELNVSVASSKAIYVPRQFLCSQKLVVLKLSGFFIDKIGHSFHLPNLEIIRFINIRFDGDQFLKSLILGCTALKKLHILGCYGFHKTLFVESSSLESLECRKKFDYVMMPLIHIRTPNLRCLHLQEAAASYDTGEFKLLTEADLYFRFTESYDDIPYQALQLIKKVSGVKSLRLGSSDMMVCCFVNGIPNFKNLIELKITANLVMYELLESAPKLKYLIIEDVAFVSESFYSNAVPGCMSCLENVEILIGRDRDHVRLVEHIFKVATALKKMKIHVQPDMIRKKRTIQQRLLDLPRSSPICQVELVYY